MWPDCAKCVTSAEIWQGNSFGHIISQSLGSHNGGRHFFSFQNGHQNDTR